MILVMNHANPDMPGNGNIYRCLIGGGYILDGNLRGPIGPQGPPGEVRWADIVPIVDRLDALTARVDRLESFSLQTLSSDRDMANDTDTVVGTVVLAPGGDYQGSAHLTFELDATDSAASPKLITAWVEGIGGVTVTGPASGQLTLHQALPYGTLSLGPVRAVSTGAGNVVLYARATELPGQPPRGKVILKAATSALGATTAKPLATGLIAR
jgi:hypothetical protein